MEDNRPQATGRRQPARKLLLLILPLPLPNSDFRIPTPLFLIPTSDFRIPTSAFTAPAIWRGGWRMVSWNFWGGWISRSRFAGCALNSVKLKRRCCGTGECAKRQS